MRTGRLLAALTAGLLLAGSTGTPAWAADDYLVVSDPGVHDELDRAPGWVTLVFRTESSATYAAIVVHNSAGENVATGGLVVEGTNVTTQLISGLPKGTYTVIYRTEDSSGEPRGGAFQFSYGPGAWTDVDDTWVGESEEPSVIATPPSPAPEQTPPASEPPAESPSEAASSPAQQSESPTAEPPVAPADGGNPPGWMVGAGAVVILGAVSGVIAYRRRGRHTA